MQQAVVEPVGPRPGYKGSTAELQFYRWGSESGPVYLADPKVPIRVPRVRDVVRKQLTATRSAVHDDSAFALPAADGSPTNAVLVDDGGNVGVGTIAPATLLHLKSTGPVMILKDTASAGSQAGYLGFGVMGAQ